MAKTLLISLGLVSLSGASFAAGRFLKKQKKKQKNGQRSDDELEKNPDALYQALLDYFNDEKPYLNPGLKVKDVTQKLLTNRTYLNRAIKENGMVDFNYFVNSYRVRMAVDIFRMDQRERVGETGVRCGFKSPSAFTMAFKVFLNMTPKQWKDYYISTAVSKLAPPKKRSEKSKRNK